MRFIFCIALSLFLCLNILAQNKQDYVWLWSNNSTSETGNEAYSFNFNKNGTNYIEALPDKLPIEFTGNNASICDSEGNLLFYTNGCQVIDATHQIMPNGDNINMEDCDFHPGTDNIMILPDPGNQKGYYIFHKTIQIDRTAFIDNLKFTYVDINMNNGLGAVTDKNVNIIDSTQILSSYLSACKHKNGTDWWIIQPVKDTNLYMRFILDSEGVKRMQDQEIGPIFHWNSSAAGTARFSPDGLKYAFFNIFEDLLLFDFDRISGQLKNLKEFSIKDSYPQIFTAIEWSADSRFLYVALNDELWQIDTWEDNLEDGRILIDRWNGIRDPFNTTFYLMALAPDCKIYMCSTSSTNTYHVINKPNEKGKACDFVQQGIRLPFVSASGTMPNFPRFRVDDEEKCDPGITSVFGDLVYYRKDLSVYPNPFIDHVTVELPEGKRGQMVAFDMQGRVVWQGVHDRYEDRVPLDLSHLPTGAYSLEFLPIDNDERLIYTSQVVKVD